jgi:Na+(H+)/acetate symporter ActP
VLLVGVLMFVFYLFAPAPMLFDARRDQALRTGSHAAAYLELETRYDEAAALRADAASAMVRARTSGDAVTLAAAGDRFKTAEADVRAVRDDARALVRTAIGDTTYNDVNYVFPTFITTRMPIGLVGLLIAAIFAAAMSSVAGELSALSATTVIDFYRRFVRTDGSDRHLLMVSKFATVFWGAFASVVAVWAAELGSLIEVVNRFGSFFYGSILGVFILAIGFPRASANGAFIGLIAGMASVAWAAAYTPVAFLWHNVIGAVVVVVVGLAITTVERGWRTPGPSER